MNLQRRGHQYALLDRATVVIYTTFAHPSADFTLHRLARFVSLTPLHSLARQNSRGIAIAQMLWMISRLRKKALSHGSDIHEEHGMKRILTMILVAIALFAGATQWQSPAQGQGKVIPAAAKQSELDQPISWLLEAKRNYTAVKDYTCTLVSKENVGGKLQEQNVIQMKMKTEPFSIYMRWLAPESSQNQEVAFVLGKNNNKMRVKSNKLKGVLGFMSIDVNDKRVMEHSRHTILEAGIGNMIEQHINQWQTDRAIGKTIVTPPVEHVYAGRKCYKIELTRPTKQAEFYCHRTVIYLEKESKMPIRLENYNWPVPGGPAGGELLEMFGYVNLQFNTGLKDADFVK
jgi:hypothetical protein